MMRGNWAFNVLVLVIIFCAVTRQWRAAVGLALMLALCLWAGWLLNRVVARRSHD